MSNWCLVQMNDISAFIDNIVDNYAITKKKTKANFSQYLKSSDIDRRTINEYIDNHITYVTDQIDELELAITGSDPVVKEGYANFRKPELREFQDILRGIVDDLYSYQDSKKIFRKRKRPTPDKLVSHLKLSDKDLVLEDKTYSPTPSVDIIGAKYIFLYNIENRELSCYYGRSLSVRNTVIDGYDSDKSWVRKLRKPEQFIDDVISCTKYNVDTIGDNLSTKPKTPSGRTLSKQILLKVLS